MTSGHPYPVPLLTLPTPPGRVEPPSLALGYLDRHRPPPIARMVTST